MVTAVTRSKDPTDHVFYTPGGGRNKGRRMAPGRNCMLLIFSVFLVLTLVEGVKVRSTQDLDAAGTLKYP